jgi:hypothetical protein
MDSKPHASHLAGLPHRRPRGPFGGPWTRPLNTGLVYVPEGKRPALRRRLEPLANSNDPTLRPYARELLAQLDELAGAA